MIGWITAIFELLGPIHKALEREIKTCGCMHVDETTLKVQKGEKDKRG
ncbi:MAG: transposase [Fibrobacteres bacterium]|nr:transposase [Fibrobacterota bacterium]MBK9580094.1 transposase [Fibrobacterota bacterium]